MLTEGYTSPAPSKVTLSKPPMAASTTPVLPISNLSVMILGLPPLAASTSGRSSVKGVLRGKAAERYCFALLRLTWAAMWCMYSSIWLEVRPSMTSLHSAAPWMKAEEREAAVVCTTLRKSTLKMPESLSGRPTNHVVGAALPTCVRTFIKSTKEETRYDSIMERSSELLGRSSHSTCTMAPFIQSAFHVPSMQCPSPGSVRLMYVCASLRKPLVPWKR
mmetsp:Transcript_42020/g.75454  ORF Transcript_42020/g.75454 Transcript_42020/m.75454 type:complete len:219 (+) Transcript_42020:1362-2018(+)